MVALCGFLKKLHIIGHVPGQVVIAAYFVVYPRGGYQANYHPCKNTIYFLPVIGTNYILLTNYTFMKRVLILALLLITAGLSNAQRTYFDVFDPNRDEEVETMKKSKEKTMVRMACELVNLSAEDSLQCLDDVYIYDTYGRLAERHNFYKKTHVIYTYDKNNRVNGYTEANMESRKIVLQITISYDKSGKITKMENSAKAVGAKGLTFSEKDQKVIISEAFEFIDEVYFKNGRIIKVINKDSKEELQCWYEYTYDDKDRITKVTGESVESGIVFVSDEMRTYDAKGRLSGKVYTDYAKDAPEEKTKSNHDYLYNDKGLLEKQFLTYPEGNMMIENKFDAQGRKIASEYVEDGTLLMTVYYYYR